MKRYSAKDSKRRNAIVGLVCYLTVVGVGFLLWGVFHGHEPQGLKPEAVTSTSAFDVSRMPPCPHEYGPPASDPMPCVWDAATMGEHPGGYTGPRWLVYLPMCPMYGPVLQNRAQVECITIGAD